MRKYAFTFLNNARLTNFHGKQKRFYMTVTVFFLFPSRIESAIICIYYYFYNCYYILLLRSVIRGCFGFGCISRELRRT